MSKRLFPVLIVSMTLLVSTSSFGAETSLGEFYGHLRYRYETVSQSGLAHQANAHTARARLGLKSQVINGFQGNIETDLVTNIGEEHYNSTTNGKTTYPTIADPRTTELNQAWLSYGGLPETTIKLGRQVLNLGNQRFISSAAWRQNDQTFDAVTIENKSLDNLSLFYGYVHKANRVFGHEHAYGELRTSGHLVHLEYAMASWLKATAYSYLLDVDSLSTLSNKTFGGRLAGEAPVWDKWKFTYDLETAIQSDHGNNQGHYNVHYWHITPGFKQGNLSLSIGLESLEGNGIYAFQTPFGGLHPFNGWADKFLGSATALGTPVNGLRDAYGKGSYTLTQDVPALKGIKIELAYHDYQADRGGTHYGSEWNGQITRTFVLADTLLGLKEISLGLKHANYHADGLLTDTRKTWLTLETKF